MRHDGNPSAATQTNQTRSKHHHLHSTYTKQRTSTNSQYTQRHTKSKEPEYQERNTIKMSSPPDSHSHTPLHDQDHDQDPSPSSAPDSTPNNPLLRTTNPLVSSLEQEVLDEYTRLLGNVNKVCTFPSTHHSTLNQSFHPSIHPILLQTHTYTRFTHPLHAC